MKKFILFFLMMSSVSAFCQDESALRKKLYNLDDGVAISGYDPVAYFTMNKAVRGNKDFSVIDNGVTYYFSSASDRDAFKKSPSHYEPQYGGWCAYAMGKEGTKVEVDPETFKILDGKLFLFYNKFFNNTLRSWNKDEKNLHQQAGINWQKLYIKQ